MSLVLVTGGAGFIGSHTVDRLIEEGFDVRILDNLLKPVHLKGKPTYLNPKAKFIVGDVRNKIDMENALENVDYVYHLAAYQDYFQDFSNFFFTNVVSTALIYEIIVEKKLPVKKIIVASSQFVQGEGIYLDNKGKIYKPDLRTLLQLQKGKWDWDDIDGIKLLWQWTSEDYANPPNAYAISKYTQELQTIRFGKRYDIPSVALRYSIVQGARQSFYNTYSGACRIFSLSYFFNRAPIIYEDGNQLRDFVNIHDVVDANIIVLKNDAANFEVFNVGGGKYISIKDFDRIVAKVFNKEHIQPEISGKFRFGDTRIACSDISKLRKLNWSPKRTTIDSVREYKEYLESQTEIEDIMAYSKKKMRESNIVCSIKS